jgi:hypothetical protein
VVSVPTAWNIQERVILVGDIHVKYSRSASSFFFLFFCVEQKTSYHFSSKRVLDLESMEHIFYNMSLHLSD